MYRIFIGPRRSSARVFLTNFPASARYTAGSLSDECRGPVDETNACREAAGMADGCGPPSRSDIVSP